MRAECPNNKEHKEFITTAHVMQEWKVDEEGRFIEVIDNALQVTHGVNKDNTWECAICKGIAIVNN
jgi:hypothetical protein